MTTTRRSIPDTATALVDCSCVITAHRPSHVGEANQQTGHSGHMLQLLGTVLNRHYLTGIHVRICVLSLISALTYPFDLNDKNVTQYTVYNNYISITSTLSNIYPSRKEFPIGTAWLL